jgi:hypothetical protein
MNEIIIAGFLNIYGTFIQKPDESKKLLPISPVIGCTLNHQVLFIDIHYFTGESSFVEPGFNEFTLINLAAFFNRFTLI